jgi:hypothetical protein
MSSVKGAQPARVEALCGGDGIVYCWLVGWSGGRVVALAESACVPQGLKGQKEREETRETSTDHCNHCDHEHQTAPDVVVNTTKAAAFLARVLSHSLESRRSTQ